MLDLAFHCIRQGLCFPTAYASLSGPLASGKVPGSALSPHRGIGITDKSATVAGSTQALGFALSPHAHTATALPTEPSS